MADDRIHAPALEKENIFVIKADRQYERDGEDVFLIYSPLAREVRTASLNEVLEMESFVKNKNQDPRVRPHVAALIDTMLSDREDADFDKLTEFTADEINRLAILPTSKCNFKCSYCYSSQGRSDKTLTKDQIKTAIDYFLNPERTTRRNMYITILGGGEPLLTWDLSVFAMEYASQRAEKLGFNLSLGLTTNGSILNDEIVHALKKYNVDVGISFEILEHIQNKQRNNYAQVCRTIDQLTANGLFPVIKPIITKENIDELPEMVKTLATRFPGVREMKIQPIDSADYFESPREMRSFYDKLLIQVIETRRLGRQFDIDVYCVMLKFGLQLKDHYCGGEFCLTPEGQISICHRFSSEKEPQFGDLVFGAVDEPDKLTIDDQTYTRLMTQNSILNPRCDDCFIKFHCSGGCIAQAAIYGEVMFKEICRFNKNIVKILIQEKAFQADAVTIG